MTYEYSNLLIRTTAYLIFYYPALNIHAASYKTGHMQLHTYKI